MKYGIHQKIIALFLDCLVYAIFHYVSCMLLLGIIPFGHGTLIYVASGLQCNNSPSKGGIVWLHPEKVMHIQ